jgi:uncharacterized membrane protein (UPF0127 family)
MTKRDFGRLRGVAALCLAVLCLAMWFAPPAGAQQDLPLEPLAIETTAGKRLFRVEVARTERQRAVGLMWRTEMAPDRGMLFDFAGERQAVMWMKNTPLSLDMLFIAADGRIATIAAHTKPYSTERIPSGVPVVAVLELLAGSAGRLGIAPGDQVRHSMFGNPP